MQHIQCESKRRTHVMRLLLLLFIEPELVLTNAEREAVFFFQLTWSTLSIGWLGDVIDIEILVSGFYCTFHFWRFLSAFVLTPAPQASRLSHKVSKYAMQMHITWIGNLVCIESGHKFENGRKWVLRPDLYCKLIRWPLGNSQNVMFATRQGIQILSIIASIKRVVSCVI